MKTGAIIATAGRTSHTGLLHPMKKIGSVSAVHRLIDTFRRAGVSPIVLVADCRAQDLEKHVSRKGTVYLCNQYEESAQMIDFLKTGFAYIQDKCERVFITPVNVPLFSVATVKTLMRSYAQTASPVYNGRVGHPLLLLSGLIPEILAYSGEGGLRNLIRDRRYTRELVTVEDEGVLWNMETEKGCGDILKRYEKQNLHTTIKICLAKDRPFLGPGSSQLLYMIAETGSVRLACQYMAMSYSKGWKIIGSIEEQLGFEVVQRQQGGKNGGNASLTPKGQRILEKYIDFEKKARGVIRDMFEKMILNDEDF